MKKYAQFGVTFREIRTKHNLTQDQIAKIGNCHGQFISNAERGICALPGKTIRLMAKKLKFSWDERHKLENAFVSDRIAQAQIEAKQMFRG